jgi:hypothetical protein
VSGIEATAAFTDCDFSENDPTFSTLHLNGGSARLKRLQSRQLVVSQTMPGRVFSDSPNILLTTNDSQIMSEPEALATESAEGRKFLDTTDRAFVEIKKVRYVECRARLGGCRSPQTEFLGNRCKIAE